MAQACVPVRRGVISADSVRRPTPPLRQPVVGRAAWIDTQRSDHIRMRTNIMLITVASKLGALPIAGMIPARDESGPSPSVTGNRYRKAR